ncbi:MAG: GDSL-type esterase/lipase family protein [Bacteroidota bacterium]
MSKRILHITILALLFALVLLPKRVHLLVPLKSRDVLLFNHSSNTIKNSQGMKVIALSDEPLKIIHIGDSHVQVGIFSNTLKALLAHRFHTDYVSPGLVFPYSVMGANNPVEYSSYHTGKWEFQKVNGATNPIDAGLFGASVKTSDCQATLSFTIKSNANFNTLVNRVTIYFQSSSPDALPVLLKPKCSKSILNEHSIEFELDADADSVAVGFLLKNGSEITIYGLNLWNRNAKFIVSSAGLNGATLHGFSLARQLTSNLYSFRPDLIIVTLGTNDAYSNGFDSLKFSNDLESLVGKLNFALPNSLVMFTTPNDHLIKRKALNPNLQLAANIISEVASSHQIPIWDFYGLMGGEGSIRKWIKQGLASPDGVHLSPKGYRLQGELFYHALCNSGFIE